MSPTPDVRDVAAAAAAELPTPRESDAWAARVLEYVKVDGRVGPLVPVIEMLVGTLGPLVAGNAEPGEDDGKPSGLGDVYRAIAEAVAAADRDDVETFHRDRGDDWRSP
jgi:hypothetical protein